jgi:hypothetical protein
LWNAGDAAADAFAAVLAGACPEIGGQVFQFGNQFMRCAEIRPDPLRGATVTMEAEIRVAVALVSAPGVHVRAARPDIFAGNPDRFAEGFARQHGLVEGGGEGLPGAVVHRPAGGDDGTHAHADEFFTEVGGKAEPVKLALPSTRPRWQQLMKTSSGTKRIWAMSPGVRKLSAPITMPEIGFSPFLAVDRRN